MWQCQMLADVRNRQFEVGPKESLIGDRIK